MSSKLEKARKYESENAGTIPKNQRPVYHMSVPVGWMNDPNGFSMYQGEAHLFYQYYPYETRWNSMHWGHVKTEDFIKWTYLPAALAPDEEYDGDGIFSGSAVENMGKQVLMYTGVKEISGHGQEKEVRQNQCIAVGDGIDFVKLKENPVITGDMLPKGSSLSDFRDPKIWKDDDTFYAVIGSRHADGSGQIALFSSVDLKTWRFCNILDRCHNRFGKMWECPDFFPLGEKYILAVSPQDMTAEGLEFHNGNGVMFLYGTFDKKDLTFKREGVHSVDYGLDFYAPQTMLTEDGRRVMIAWMKSWDTNLWPEDFKWSSMMTIPRELEYRDGRVLQNPVREIQNYYSDKVEYNRIQIQDRTRLDGISGRCLDMTVEVEAGDFQEFRIDFAGDAKFYTSLIYNREKQTVTFDRTYAGYCRDVVHTRSMYVREKDGKLKLRLLLDRYSAEIFVNDGEQAMTSLVYTDQGANEIHFQSEGGSCISVKKFTIQESHKNI